MERTRTPGTPGKDVCAGGLEMLAAVAARVRGSSSFNSPLSNLCFGDSGCKSQQAKEKGLCSDIKLETQ